MSRPYRRLRQERGGDVSRGIRCSTSRQPYPATAAAHAATAGALMPEARFPVAVVHGVRAAHPDRRAQKSHAEGGEVLLLIPGPPVLRVVELTGIDKVIPSFPTLAEALAQSAGFANGRSRQQAEGDARAENQPV